MSWTLSDFVTIMDGYRPWMDRVWLPYRPWVPEEAPPPAVHTLTLRSVPCPTCGADGWGDPCYSGREETCLGGSSPHDPNCVSTRFACPSGHVFYATTQYQCSCGWEQRPCEMRGHRPEDAHP